MTTCGWSSPAAKSNSRCSRAHSTVPRWSSVRHLECDRLVRFAGGVGTEHGRGPTVAEHVVDDVALERLATAQHSSRVGRPRLASPTPGICEINGVRREMAEGSVSPLSSRHGLTFGAVGVNLVRCPTAAPHRLGAHRFCHCSCAGQGQPLPGCRRPPRRRLPRADHGLPCGVAARRGHRAQRRRAVARGDRGRGRVAADRRAQPGLAGRRADGRPTSAARRMSRSRSRSPSRSRAAWPAAAPTQPPCWWR